MTIALATSVIDTHSPRGNPVRLHYREGTSDLSVIFSTFSAWGAPPNDEYRLADVNVTGLALDIGAHVGAVTAALLADNPECRVIAVEPIADNCRVIRATLRENGWTKRARVVRGAFGSGSISWGFTGSETAATNRYIGNLSHMAGEGPHHVTEAPVVTLSDLAPKGAAFAKIDCEGCEWRALDDPAVAGIGVIVGEAHGDTPTQTWPERVRALLDATHEVAVRRDDGGVGLFEAVRR